MSKRVGLVALLVLVTTAGAWLGAQEQPTAKPTQEFWIQRAPGGKGYVAPNKPHHKIADVKARHKGQTTWRETVVKDGESIAEYVSVAPGGKLSPRLHPATPTLFVVFEGEMRWQIENQEAFTAKRGSMVHVPAWTIFSYEAVGAAPAIFIEVNAAHYEPVFPATSPAPAALPGRVVTKTRFDGRTPTPYVAPNRPHFNLHDSIAAGRGGGVFVRTGHMYANANFGFADPNDPANPNRGRGGAGRGAGAAPPPIATINPNVPGGHLHPDNVEWWIVLTGQISAKFEAGHFIASEGDVLYAPPYMLHAMANHGPGGSCRIAIGWYDPEHFDPVGQ
jgi:mannose-6-phosphate isomerase-like protein (cupin superfamily)